MSFLRFFSSAAVIAVAFGATACSTNDGLSHAIDHAEVADLGIDAYPGVQETSRAMLEARWSAHEAERSVAQADALAASELGDTVPTSEYQNAHREYLQARATEARANAILAEATHEMAQMLAVGRRDGESLDAYDARVRDFQSQWLDAKEAHVDAAEDTAERRVALDAVRQKLARR